MPWGIKVYRKNPDIIGDVFSFGGCNEVCFDLATYENLNAIEVSEAYKSLKENFPIKLQESLYGLK